MAARGESHALFDRRVQRTPHCLMIVGPDSEAMAMASSGHARSNEFELSFALRAVPAAFIR